MAKAGSRSRSRADAPVCEVDVVHLDAVKKARKAAPSDEQLRQTAELMSVLSSETRLRILLALATTELCVCDLAQTIGQSVSSTSHQLRSLRHLGLVQHRAEGKLVFYRLGDRDAVDIIGRALKVVQ